MDPVEIAEHLSRQRRPRWTVVWGQFTHQFVAFPMWYGNGGKVTVATTPERLTELLDEIERNYFG